MTIERVDPNLVGSIQMDHSALLSGNVLDDGGYLTRSFYSMDGWPPTYNDGTLYPGEFIDLPATQTPITRPCGISHLRAGEPFEDIVVSITSPDPARGGGIDGLVIAYRYQGRVRTVRANVTWLLCGTDPAQDICLEYDDDWREDDGGPSADATNT